MDTAALAAAIREGCASRPGIAAVYLFGSTARGTARADSDVDVGVLYVVAPPPTLQGQSFDLADELSRRLGRPVDLVVLNEAPVDLRMRVLRDRTLIVDTAPDVRIRFEVRTRNEAFDLEPVQREYRRGRKTA